MLKRLLVNNFKSLVNLEFLPTRSNLLLGPNNAGKTNLCTALRFLGLTSKQTLDTAALSAVGERWNLTNFYVKNQNQIEFQIQASLNHKTLPIDEALNFSYSLRIGTSRGDKAGTESLAVLDETLRVSGGAFQDIVLLENKHGQARMLHEEGFIRRDPRGPFYVEALAPINATMLSHLFELENNPRAVLFRRYLQSWSYYNFSPELLRMPDVSRDDGSLLFSGANFSRALFDLHNEKPRLERTLIEAVKQIEPKLDLLSYSAPDPEHVYFFLEDDKGNRSSARSTSDGTLRFMALVFVLLISRQETNPWGFSPLVIIEEPENGIYVGLLKPLMEKISLSADDGQFIFTSHSPYFIDLFDNNLIGIHVLKRGIPSSTLSRPDYSLISRLLDEMSLGEMHFRDLLT